MKIKFVCFLILLGCVFCSAPSYAQNFDETRFGVKIGATSSVSSMQAVTTKNTNLFHIGAFVNFPLSYGFAIQPGLQYQMKGMNLSNMENSTLKDISTSFETKVGYLELPVQVQWGLDLLAFRPYIFMEPFLGYKVTDSSKFGNIKTDNKAIKSISNDLKKVEYGVSLGAGLEFWRLQLSANYYWNLGNIYNDGGEKAIKKMKKALNSGKNFNGVMFSLAYIF